MILTVNHETIYRYDSTVRHSTQYLRLTPADSAGQRVLEWRLDLPSPAFVTRDSHGNILHVLTLDMPHDEIRIRAVGIVETGDGDRVRVAGADPRPYLRTTPLTALSPALRDFADAFRRDLPAVEGVEALAHAVHAWMRYDPGSTAVETTAAEAFGLARGVCQDYTHVMLACCRHLGIPARYVSGYVHAGGAGFDERQASHCWVEAWVDGQWWSFDVTNRCRAHAAHLELAVGMDYHDACPVRGVRRGGGMERLQADVRVMQAPPEAGAADWQAMEQQQQ